MNIELPICSRPIEGNGQARLFTFRQRDGYGNENEMAADTVGFIHSSMLYAVRDPSTVLNDLVILDKKDDATEVHCPFYVAYDVGRA